MTEINVQDSQPKQKFICQDWELRRYRPQGFKTAVYYVKIAEEPGNSGCEMRLSIFADLASHRNLQSPCDVCIQNPSPTSHKLPNPSQKNPGGSRCVEVVFLPARTGQKTSQLPTMDQFGGNDCCGQRARHPPAVQHKCQRHPNEQMPSNVVQRGLRHTTLERTSRFDDDESGPCTETLSLERTMRIVRSANKVSSPQVFERQIAPYRGRSALSSEREAIHRCQ